MADQPTVREYNRLLLAAKLRAQRHETQIRERVHRVYNAAVNRMTARFRAEAQPITAAADTKAAWAKVNADHIFDRLRMEAELHQALDGIYVEITRDVMEGILRRYGLRFDVRNPLIAGVIEQHGFRITRMTETEQQRLMGILDQAWQDGSTIPQAAARLASEGSALSLGRATTIARTELIGVMNGGSWALTRMTGAARFKVWLVAPGAKNPRHEKMISLANQVRPLVQTFSVEGWPAQYPGDVTLPPEHSVNCRCTVAYSDDPTGAIR